MKIIKIVIFVCFLEYIRSDLKYIVEKLFFSQYKFGAKQGGIL